MQIKIKISVFVACMGKDSENSDYIWKPNCQLSVIGNWQLVP